MSHCASLFYLNGRSESSSFRAERLTANKKYKFSPKNKAISTRLNDHISTGGNEHISVTEPVEVTSNAFHIFNSQPLRRKTLEQARKYLLRVFAVFGSEADENASGASKQKLVSKPQGLRRKVPSEASDTSAQSWKVLSEASDAFAQFGNMLSEASDAFARVGNMPSEGSDGFAQFGNTPSEASDGFAQVGKVPSEGSDASAQVGNMLSEASDGFAQVGKVPSEASDASAQVGNMPSEASDTFARVGKALSEASDSLTATESRDNVGFDRQKSSVCEFCEAKLVKQGFALRLEPVEITTGNLQT